MFHPRIASLSRKELPQMKSDWQQPAFYQGGSQVPQVIKNFTGKGFRNESELEKKSHSGKYRTLNTNKL
jgi:hypothetical protein